MSGAPLGRVEPRLWTPPLRDLTPDTSYGFDFNDFCRDVLDEPNDPWQEWLSIHAGELLPDGRPRFRILLALVSRQQGKTVWGKKLIKYWLFVDRVPLVLGTSTSRMYAKMTWQQICDEVMANEWLRAECPPNPIRLTIGEEALVTNYGQYRFAASNRRAGRSMTVHRALLDEIREHTTFDAWNATSKAMNAVRDAQLVAISNQGDDNAIVLDSLRTPAVRYLETGEGDPRLGLFEWSSPPGSDPTDLEALAYANPDLGNRTDPDVLRGDAIRAVAAGGEELAGFRTEVMCQRVALLDPAIDPDAWDACGTDEPISLADHRDRLALAFDVSMDASHATLAAAAVVDGKIRVEIVQQWHDTASLRRDLPSLVRRIRPRVVGWFPAGPAAAVAADLEERRQPGVEWPPKRVQIEAIRGDTAAVCMGFAEIVHAGEVEHPKDPMLDQHIAGAQRLRRGDTWVFQRRGASPIDATYAVAGAVHLARTLPPAPPPLAVV